MSSSKHDVNSYSSEGRLYQLEYAMQASNLGTTTIGFVTEDAAVLISEKKVINKLQGMESIKKHYIVFDHLVFGYSGIAADARSIVKMSRKFCCEHFAIFNENIPCEKLLKHLCKIALNFGDKDDAMKIFGRPFGSSILIAAWDEGPKIYSFDPSGSYEPLYVKVLGGAAKGIEVELNKNYSKGDSTEKTIRMALAVLKEVMKDPLTKMNVEITLVDKNGIKFVESNEIEGYLPK